MRVRIEHTLEQPSLKVSANDSQTPIVFSIDLSIDTKHRIVGLFGPSGAGKSSILKVLAGLVPNADYTIVWNGKDYTNNKAHHNPCVYVGEDTQLFEHITLLENLRLVQKQSETFCQSPFSLETTIALCNLEDLSEKMPWQLSTGEKQRACFARALLSGKKILLLDEAFSALDWTKRMAFNRLLREVVMQHGYFVLMVSHSLKELSLCATKLLTVESGQVVEQAKISDALTLKFANNNIEHEQYFSAINATYSHCDKQDSTLHVWHLQSKHLLNKRNQEICHLFIKEQKINSLCVVNHNDSSSSHELNEAQTFIVDANKVSVSLTANHQTSMVNCVPITVQSISGINSGVLLSGNWNQQTMRSIVTKKSLSQLNIKVGDMVYFVFKAL